MKLYFILSICLLIFATTAQGFRLKGRKRTQSLNSPLSDSTTGSGINNLSGPINYPPFQAPLSGEIPPTVTLYQYPVQHQVIHRTIRPVIRRIVYVQAPEEYDIERTIPQIINNIIPSPISGVLRGLKSTVSGILMP